MNIIYFIMLLNLIDTFYTKLGQEFFSKKRKKFLTSFWFSINDVLNLYHVNEFYAICYIFLVIFF